jgi:DNA-binding SARP family transcriptional activator
LSPRQATKGTDQQELLKPSRGLEPRTPSRLAEEGRQALERGDAEAAAELLREALALWRGAPLADLAYESFAQVPVARLEEIRLAALEERIEAELALGRHAQLTGELEELIAEHPLRERFRAQLMLVLYRAGRQAEALDFYRRTLALPTKW